MCDEPSEAMAPKSGAMVVLVIDTYCLARMVYSWSSMAVSGVLAVMTVGEPAIAIGILIVCV